MVTSLISPFFNSLEKKKLDRESALRLFQFRGSHLWKAVANHIVNARSPNWAKSSLLATITYGTFNLLLQKWQNMYRDPKYPGEKALGRWRIIHKKLGIKESNLGDIGWKRVHSHFRKTCYPNRSNHEFSSNWSPDLVRRILCRFFRVYQCELELQFRCFKLCQPIMDLTVLVTAKKAEGKHLLD